jgi:hypothetical protein
MTEAGRPTTVVLRANGGPRVPKSGHTIIKTATSGAKNSTPSSVPSPGAHVSKSDWSELGVAEEILWSFGTSNSGWNKAVDDTKNGIQIFERPASDINRFRGQSSHSAPTNAKDKIMMMMMNKTPHSAPLTNGSGSGSGSGKTKDWKIWKVCGMVEGKADEIFDLMVNSSRMSSWNHDVYSFRTIEVIDTNTDIIQCITNPAASGTISKREFITLRRQSKKQDGLLVASVGTTHPMYLAPPKDDIVRGSNGPSGFMVRSIPGVPNTSWVCWIMNTDLKGWIPKLLVESSISRVLTDWVKQLRTGIAAKKKQRT